MAQMSITSLRQPMLMSTLAVVSLLLPLLTPVVAAPTLSLREDLLQLEPAVVAILAIDEEGNANQGTGFIVRPDGLLITCEHVIRNAATIEVHWSSQLDRESEVATILQRDTHNDLALLQLPNYNYPVIPLATVADIRVGDAVATLGYPVGDILGLTDLSVTRGIVSALRRNDSGVVELVQTDAPIFMGNSGGPLFDLDLGGVVGVVRAKGIEELSGINFASGVEALLATFPEVTVDTSGQLTSTQTTTLLLGASDARTSMPQLFESTGYADLHGFVEDMEWAGSPAGHPLLSRDLSLPELEAFLAHFPEHAQANYLRGCLLVEADANAAREAFLTAIALCPSDGLSAVQLAELAEARGNAREADRWTKRAAALGFPTTTAP